MNRITKTVKGLSWTWKVQLTLPILALLVLLTIPQYSQQYTVLFLTKILMDVILTVSWVMFSGPTRYISLASAAFFGIGVYTAALLGRTLDFSIIVVIGGLLCFCVALLFGPFTLRLKGIYFAMFTFGLVQLILNLVHWYATNILGKVGLVVVSVSYMKTYYLMLIVFVVLMLTAFLIRRSKYGLALQSIGECEEAAMHIGINTTWLKVVVFALSAFFIGAAGAIIASRWTYINASIAFNLNYSFIPVFMAILGGMSLLYGPIIGAVFFCILEELLVTRLPSLYMLIFGATLVVAMVYLPDGFVGLLQKWWKRGSEAKHEHNRS